MAIHILSQFPYVSLSEIVSNYSDVSMKDSSPGQPLLRLVLEKSPLMEVNVIDLQIEFHQQPKHVFRYNDCLGGFASIWGKVPNLTCNNMQQ